MSLRSIFRPWRATPALPDLTFLAAPDGPLTFHQGTLRYTVVNQGERRIADSQVYIYRLPHASPDETSGRYLIGLVKTGPLEPGAARAYDYRLGEYFLEEVAACGDAIQVELDGPNLEPESDETNNRWTYWFGERLHLNAA